MDLELLGQLDLGGGDVFSQTTTTTTSTAALLPCCVVVVVNGGWMLIGCLCDSPTAPCIHAQGGGECNPPDDATSPPRACMTLHELFTADADAADSINSGEKLPNAGG